MTMIDGSWLQSLVKDHNQGESKGVFAVCSSHPMVLESSLEYAVKTKRPVLIESTCNQVNQYGGYTGWKPLEFVEQILNMQDTFQGTKPQMLLGGDHLGPYPWRSLAEDEALRKAYQLVVDYVEAGYGKIHLDASMHLGSDDPAKPLTIDRAAERTAYLCQAAEQSIKAGAAKPVYVIGSEVPAPGGEQEGQAGVAVTTAERLQETITQTKEAFNALGLEKAWERVIAVVVQPGVEFYDQDIETYNPAQAQHLSELIENYSNLAYEAHSTDFQPQASLENLVRDHFVILKVGPELTFTYREGIFALEQIELALAPLHPGWALSHISKILDHVMELNPENWQDYYPGSTEKQAFSRKYSFLDRIRYYWNYEEVRQAKTRLFANLNSCSLPLSLIRQYFPHQYQKIRAGALENHPGELVRDKIHLVLERYDPF
jgi:D-tagatose-1,6-bisphosphate aldolase subunit GatZ/KbaZ